MPPFAPPSAVEAAVDCGTDGSSSVLDHWWCRQFYSDKFEYWEPIAAGVLLLLLLLLAAAVCRCRRRGNCICCRRGQSRASMEAKEKLLEGHYRGAIKTGYLQKQGHLRKNWKQRFFVLENTVLLYYERPSDARPKGTVRMDDITLCLATEQTGKPHCFGIFHPLRDTYYLAASSEQEMMKWVRAIRGDGKVGLVDFDVVSKLGQGNFGKVVLVKKKTTKSGAQAQYYAMKILRKEAIIQRNDVAHANAERRILQQINHPFIVRLHYAFQTAEKLYMVMDFVSGGDLYFHLRRRRRFSMEQVRVWLPELVLAIEYLHSMGVVYRDLKPENILLDRAGHLHLADFGLSKQSEEAEKAENAKGGDAGAFKTFCGTPYYVAPEMLRRDREYTMVVDWWSLGILCFELLKGQPPFYSGNVERVYEKILKAKLEFPAAVREDARKLISALLEREPSARLGASGGAQQVKAHPFFASPTPPVRPTDWQAVFELQVETGFSPQAASEMDEPSTQNFDDQFTRQRAEDSFEQPAFLDPNDPKMAQFEGFSYRGQSPSNPSGSASTGRRRGLLGHDVSLSDSTSSPGRSSGRAGSRRSPPGSGRGVRSGSGSNRELSYGSLADGRGGTPPPPPPAAARRGRAVQ